MYIFGVGLNKTGTTSLGAGLRLLGFRAFHHEGEGLKSSEISRRVELAIHQGLAPLSGVPELASYDAFFDVRAVEDAFEKFDVAYPGSKFILHTRELEAWLRSREKHVERNVASGRNTWTVVDVEAWVEERRLQHERVRTYFADRPEDLLEIDITRVRDPWGELCPFLNVRRPTAEFPQLNKQPSVRSRAASYLRRIGPTSRG